MSEGFVGGPSSSGGLGAWILRRESKPGAETRRPMTRVLYTEDFRAADDLAAAGKDVFWKPQGPLNQGQTPECVPHAGRNLQLATPNPALWLTADAQVPDAAADMLYPLAQGVDGIPLPHAGTTVHGLYIAMQKLGLVTGDPVWASSPDDVLAWVRTRGPVIFAGLWFEQMNQVDSGGYVVPGGTEEGGHSYLVMGANSSDEVFCWQPWGQWGASLNNVMDQATGTYFSLPTGVFKLTRQSLQTLFDDGHAEGVAPSKTPPAPKPTPQPPIPDWKVYPWWEAITVDQMVRRAAGSTGSGAWRTGGWLEQHQGKEWTWHPPGQ